MRYCFVKEDLQGLSKHDPLIIQANYAMELNKFCCCSLLEQCIKDSDGSIIDVSEDLIFLRATCNTMYTAIKLLKSQNVKLIEDETDIKKIEYWDRYNISQRQIYSVCVDQILQKKYSDEIRCFLECTPKVFIKSRKKGFCAKISAEWLLDDNNMVISLLSQYCKNTYDELMISELFDNAKDSFGVKETRHFVLNRILTNSSRKVHTLKHSVMKSHIIKANDVIARLNMNTDFPVNYVLDIGDFKKQGKQITDVVEINPITSSLCYVNNSIFNQKIQKIENIFDMYGIGYEYCYDCLTNRQLYSLKRYFNVNYEYKNENYYNLIV